MLGSTLASSFASMRFGGLDLDLSAPRKLESPFWPLDSHTEVSPLPAYVARMQGSATEEQSGPPDVPDCHAIAALPLLAHLDACDISPDCNLGVISGNVSSAHRNRDLQVCCFESCSRHAIEDCFGIFAKSVLLMYLLSCCHLLLRTAKLKKQAGTTNRCIRLGRSCFRGAPLLLAVGIVAPLIPCSAGMQTSSIRDVVQGISIEQPSANQQRDASDSRALHLQVKG